MRNTILIAVFCLGSLACDFALAGGGFFQLSVGRSRSFIRQPVVVQRQFIRQPVVVQQQFGGYGVQQFVAPVYRQQFVAPVYRQQFVAPVYGVQQFGYQQNVGGCGGFFGGY